jgi:hypothetical protein
MSRSANNIELQVGVRVAALDENDNSWIFPGIITAIDGLSHTVHLDAKNNITNVSPAHLWVIDLAKDYPKLYWDYPTSFANILSKYSLPEYFNRSIPLRAFGFQLIQGMYLFANKAVFNGKIPQPKWQITSMQAAGSANRQDVIKVSSRALSLRHLFDTICHELTHLYQFHYVSARQQALEVPVGLHGQSFMAWKEPLAKIGVILTVGDTGDADLEIPDPGKRDKEQILLLVKSGTIWRGGIASSEEFARKLAILYSKPGDTITLVRVRGTVLMHGLLPIKAKGRIRLIELNSNVIDYIRKHGQPLFGFDLP